jgi:hypothetical protein
LVKVEHFEFEDVVVFGSRQIGLRNFHAHARIGIFSDVAESLLETQLGPLERFYTRRYTRLKCIVGRECCLCVVVGLINILGNGLLRLFELKLCLSVIYLGALNTRVR